MLSPRFFGTHGVSDESWDFSNNAKPEKATHQNKNNRKIFPTPLNFQGNQELGSISID